MISFPTILNPASGRGAAGRISRRLHAAASAIGLSLDIIQTEGPGDARRIACDLASGGARIVAVAGGDGTLSEVAAALAGTGTALAILPLGTGNDLVRHLGTPLDPEAAVRALADWRGFAIDVGVANGRPFIVAVGAGLDAAVAAAVNEGPRWLRGSLAYAAAVIGTLGRYHPTRFRVEVDDETDEFEGLFAVAANVRGYGGGMQIAPEASLRDGMLDVCCVHSLSKARFLLAAGSVYRGRHTTHPAVRMYRGRQVRIESTPAVRLVADGELMGLTPLEACVQPAALTIALPRSSEDPT